MKFELTGVLYEKFDTNQRTATFKVKEFVLEHSEEFNGKTNTNYIKFQCTQDRVSILDKINTGEKIKVTFSIRGSKWEKNGQVSYFNNLDAWRVETLSESHPSNPETSVSDLPGMPDSIDDLPF